MSSTVDSLPAPGRSSVPALLKSGNILPASAWLFLVFNQAFNSPFPPSLSTVLLVLINSVTIILFIIRRDATRVGSKAEMLIAVSAEVPFSITAILSNSPRVLRTKPRQTVPCP